MEDGPVNTLLEAHQRGFMLWLLCRYCGHVKGMEAFDALRRVRRSDRPLPEVARHFLCSKCNKHHCILIPGSRQRWAHQMKRIMNERR